VGIRQETVEALSMMYYREVSQVTGGLGLSFCFQKASYWQEARKSLVPLALWKGGSFVSEKVLGSGQFRSMLFNIEKKGVGRSWGSAGGGR